jgi:hypothetical protein
MYNAPAEVRVRLDGLQSELRRMCQWATIPILCYLIEHLRMLPEWPSFVAFP